MTGDGGQSPLKQIFYMIMWHIEEGMQCLSWFYVNMNTDYQGNRLVCLIHPWPKTIDNMIKNFSTDPQQSLNLFFVLFWPMCGTSVSSFLITTPIKWFDLYLPLYTSFSSKYWFKYHSTFSSTPWFTLYLPLIRVIPIGHSGHKSALTNQNDFCGCLCSQCSGLGIWYCRSYFSSFCRDSGMIRAILIGECQLVISLANQNHQHKSEYSIFYFWHLCAWANMNTVKRRVGISTVQWNMLSKDDFFPLKSIIQNQKHIPKQNET